MRAQDGRVDNDNVTIGVRLTWEQFQEINRRAGIRPLVSARARSAYIVGCLFDEPHDALLDRVRRIAADDQARFRAELDAARAQRDASRARVSA